MIIEVSRACLLCSLLLSLSFIVRLSNHQYSDSYQNQKFVPDFTLFFAQLVVFRWCHHIVVRFPDAAESSEAISPPFELSLCSHLMASSNSWTDFEVSTSIQVFDSKV